VIARFYRTDSTLALLRVGNSATLDGAQAPEFGSDGTNAVIHNNNAERLRITSAGNVGIGTTSPSTALEVNGTVTATTFAGSLSGNAATVTNGVYTVGDQTIGGTKTFSGTIFGRAGGAFAAITDLGFVSPIQISETQTGTTANRFVPMISGTSQSPIGYRQHTVFGSYRAGVWGSAFIGVGGNDNYPTVAFYFGSDGNFISPGNVTAYSDIRLKEDLEPIPDAIEKVQSLTGYTYTRIDSGQRQTGLIAQEVQKVLPEAVMDNGEHLSLAYGNMVGLLIEAIKAQQVQIDELRAKLEG
jgi:hypothetical protein